MLNKKGKGQVKQQIVAVNGQVVGAAKYPIITNGYIIFSDEPYTHGVTNG